LPRKITTFARIKSTAILSALILSVPANAYFEKFPPFSTDDIKKYRLDAKPAANPNQTEYSSGDVRVVLGNRDSGVHLSIKDSGNFVFEIPADDAGGAAVPQEVYHIDLNGDGAKDFVVISSYQGAGLASFRGKVDLLIKMGGAYSKISYDTWAPDIHDFPDLNGDGAREVIVAGVYEELGETFVNYNVFRISKGLLSFDGAAKGFPKFIRMKDQTVLSEPDLK
jgi:hypothetical protein